MKQPMIDENSSREIEVTATDLPLRCPMPSMTRWNTHPRIFLPIEPHGEARCPYCGTHYRLKGPLPAAHH